MAKLTTETISNLVVATATIAALAIDAKKKRNSKKQEMSKRISLDNHASIKHWSFSKNDSPVFTITKDQKAVNVEIKFDELRNIEEQIRNDNASWFGDVRYSVKSIENGQTVTSWCDDGNLLIYREDNVVVISVKDNYELPVITVTVPAWKLEEQAPSFKELVNHRWAKAIMNRF